MLLLLLLLIPTLCHAFTSSLPVSASSSSFTKLPLHHQTHPPIINTRRCTYMQGMMIPFDDHELGAIIPPRDPQPSSPATSTSSSNPPSPSKNNPLHHPSTKQDIESRVLAHLAQCPFIAVLRGIESSNLKGTIAQLRQTGLTMLSIPAESPAGIKSVKTLLTSLQQQGYEEMMIGAATVINVNQVHEAAEHGASFVSCPHMDPEIIEVGTSKGLLVMPGIMTPSEAFVAVKHGATILKLFPSQGIPPGMVKSMRAVLPPHIKLLVSGGVQPEHLGAYIRAGAIGFALGSTLYQSGLSRNELRKRVVRFMSTYHEVKEEMRLATPGASLIADDLSSGFLGDPLSSPVYG